MPTSFPRLFTKNGKFELYQLFVLCFSFGPFFTEPVIAGIEENGKIPFICSMDLIGCINFAKDFVVAGTASANLYGICESLFEPDMVHMCFLEFFITIDFRSQIVYLKLSRNV